MDEDGIGMEAFERLAAQVGLDLTPEELETMLEGYRGLRELLARLPREPDLSDEPAAVFLAPETRVVL